MQVKAFVALLLLNFHSSFAESVVSTESATCEGFIFLRESGEVGVAKFDTESNQLSTVRTASIPNTGTLSSVKSTFLAGKLDGSEAATITYVGFFDLHLVFQPIYSGEEDTGHSSAKQILLDEELLAANFQVIHNGITFEYSQSGDFFAFDYDGNTAVYDRRKGAESTDSVFRKYSPRSRFRTARKETPASRTQIARVEYGVASARLEIVDVVSNNIVESVDLGAESLEYPELRDISFNENGTIALVTLFGESYAKLHAVRLESSRDADSSGSSAGVVMWHESYLLNDFTHSHPSVIVADEWIYYAQHFYIQKLNIANGNQEWADRTGGYSATNGEVSITNIQLLNNNSIVLVSLSKGTQYKALQTSDGKVIASFEPSPAPENPPVVFTASYSGNYLFSRVAEGTTDWNKNPYEKDYAESTNYLAFAAVYLSTGLDNTFKLDDYISHAVLGRPEDKSRLIEATRFATITSCPPFEALPYHVTTLELGIILAVMVVIGFGICGIGYGIYKVFCAPRKAPKTDTTSTVLVTDTPNVEEALPVATQMHVPATEQQEFFQVNNPVRAVDDVIPVLEPVEDSKA